MVHTEAVHASARQCRWSSQSRQNRTMSGGSQPLGSLVRQMRAAALVRGLVEHTAPAFQRGRAYAPLQGQFNLAGSIKLRTGPSNNDWRCGSGVAQRRMRHGIVDHSEVPFGLGLVRHELLPPGSDHRHVGITHLFGLGLVLLPPGIELLVHDLEGVPRHREGRFGTSSAPVVGKLRRPLRGGHDCV